MKMHTRVQNPEADKVVLLFHGWMHSSARWSSLMQSLSAKNYHIIAVDFPGFGHSANIENTASLSLEKLIEITSDFIAEVQQKKPIYATVAHSMGGLIALGCLKLNPLYTDHFFLCDLPTTTDGFLKPFKAIRPLFVPAFKINRVLPLILSVPFIKIASLSTILHYEQVDEIMIKDALLADPMAAARLFDDIGTFNLLNRPLPQLPLSVVSRGEFDRIVTPEDGAALQKLLGAAYIEFKGTSHTPQLEDAAQFNKIISDYLDDPTTFCKNHRP
jgi:pimeloyl-ACP methyl ester carboxylesterase